MNERIDKLIEQCTRQNFSDCVGGYETFDKEKFAKLIVKECIEGIKEWRDASDEHMDKEEYWKGYRSGCSDAIVEIIQRFGVEE